MHFTREPIIETVITPKSGYVLSVASSKGLQEGYMLEAIEVVTLGRQTFYRSVAGNQGLLLPTEDYSVVEIKEPRVALKTPALEKGIKIGKGNTPPVVEEVKQESEKDPEKKKKRSRHKKNKKEETPQLDKMQRLEGADVVVKTEVQRYYIPPPTQLISDTIARYKDLTGMKPGEMLDTPRKEDSLDHEAFFMDEETHLSVPQESEE